MTKERHDRRRRAELPEDSESVLRHYNAARFLSYHIQQWKALLVYFSQKSPLRGGACSALHKTRSGKRHFTCFAEPIHFPGVGRSLLHHYNAARFLSYHIQQWKALLVYFSQKSPLRGGASSALHEMIYFRLSSLPESFGSSALHAMIYKIACVGRRLRRHCNAARFLKLTW
jgi:hypothetical protein